MEQIFLEKQLTGTSAKKDFTVDESLFDTDESKEGWDTIVNLINTATADRNNVSGYSDIGRSSGSECTKWLCINR